MKIYLNLLLVLSFLVLPTQVMAETPEEKGRAIAIEIDNHDLGWVDNKSIARMTLRNRHGQESIRNLRIHNLEVSKEGFGDKSLTIFDSPGDIRGTAFLSHTKVLKADDQWLYLPALKRVKRISSSNKSGAFVGSEFAYEDLLSQEVEKYNYKWLRDETYNGLDVFVVERYPLYKNSGYTKQVIWVDKAEYRPHKEDFYDRKGTLLKTLTFKGYQQYINKYWRADILKMVNHQNGKSTDLIIKKWEFGLGQTESLFTPTRLKHMR